MVIRIENGNDVRVSMAIVLRHAKHLLSMQRGRKVNWDEVAEFFGLDPRHRKYLTNEPGYSCSPDTKLKIMAKYLTLLEPPPLPTFALLWRDKLIQLKARPGSAELKDHLESWAAFFDHPGLSGDQVTAAVLGYCNLLSYMTMALQDGKSATWFDVRTSLEKAEQIAARTKNLLAAFKLNELTEDNRKTIAWLRRIVFLNWIQTIVEREKRNFSRTREEVEAILEKENVLTEIRDTLQENPFFWQLVYNALEIACVLRDEDAAWEFYSTLVELDPGFKNLGYTPGEVISIRDEPNMEFFRNLFAQKKKNQTATPQTATT